MKALPFDIGGIHFVGIGGIGMSGIAEVMHNLGYRVGGSDQAENANVQRLRAMGVPVTVGHDGANLGTAQVVVASSAIDSSPVEFQGLLPLLYGKARVDLPFSGFWLGAEVSGADLDGNSLIDGNLVLGWESPYRIGIEAGWRTYRLKLDDFDDVDSADVEVSGPFAAINVLF